MSQNDPKMPICGNGHTQPVHGSRFCIYCGVGMAAAAPVPAASRQGTPQTPPPNPGYQVHGNVPPTDQNKNPAPVYPPPPVSQYYCGTCGGHGQGLADKLVICRECNWLRPLVPGYTIDNSAFAWAADAKAMNALKAMKPLNAAAKAVSEKVGRRWIEVAFNGVLLGERQMPHIFGQAVRAARILGMSHMPDVYLSGENPWDCLTFGSDNDSFIVVGSALAGNFQGVDMLFLLAREMGHCKAGHALWKTVIRFFLGEQGPAKGFMAGGIFNAILSPTALIGGALEVPLLAWARQAEITADRAGLLTVGSEDVARRVLMSWSLKSSFIYKQINIESWIEQQDAGNNDFQRLSELTTTSTPYLGPRLKLLSDYSRSPELRSSLNYIHSTIRSAAPSPPPKTDPKPEVIKLKCASCSTPMRIPIAVLAGKTDLPVKCPNKSCGSVTRLKKNVKKQAAPIPNEKKIEENLNYAE